jgi:GAF domain-containing protein
MTNRQASPLSSPQRPLDWLVHTEARDPAVRRRGRITASLLVVAAIAALLLLVGRLIVSVTTPGGASAVSIALPSAISLLVLFGLFMLNRRGYTAAAGGLLALLILILDFVFTDMAGRSLPGPAALIMPVLIAGLLGPPISAFVIAVLAVIGHFALNAQADPQFVSEVGSNAPGLLNLYVQLFAAAFASWLFARTTHTALAESSEYSLALTQQRQDLETRVTTQSRYLQATTTIARSIVGLRDIDELLADTVDLVRDTFDYYHVQVFLVDEERQYAVLHSSTGEAGRVLLERSHRLPIGSLSVIGQVTAGGRPVIARDTDADAVHRRNELLVDTRSEMALPLLANNKVIGALDLQSTESDAFGPDVIPILQSLADQLAIAIENARLYTQTQSSMRELEELYGDVTERSWAEFLAQTREEEKRQVYGSETKSLEVQRSVIVKRVLGTGGVIISTGSDGRQPFLAAPVIVRNEVVGVIGVEPDGPREWTQDDLQLMQNIAERTALAVENARLYLQSQRVADRERLVNTIAGRLQRAPTLQLLLQSAADELSRALGTENVYAEISLDQPMAQVRSGASESTEPVEGQARPNAESEEARAEL